MSVDSREITDPPTPEHQAAAGRPAGDLPRGTCPTCGWPTTASAKDGCVPGDCSLRRNPAYEEIMALAIDVEALRAKVAGLSFALARECELRQAAERERDAVIGLFVTPNAGTYVVFLNNNWRRYDSYKSAVAAVRAAAGLDAERSDRAD